MSIASWVLAAAAGLPRAQNKVRVRRDLRVPMPDGVELLADRWYPDRTEGDRAPILLARLPYGRVDLLGRVLAERGYQAVLVSCRGTFGSGGTWVPFRNERADGHAVLAWLADRPWFSGAVGTVGASYFGLTQWAVADSPPEWLRSMSLAVTASSFRNMFYPGDGFALESVLGWTHGLEHQELPRLARWLAGKRRQRRLDAAFATVPLADTDRVAVGHRVDYYQDWLQHDEPDDPWWGDVDFGRALDQVPSASMVAGWYDVFLPDQLADFRALRNAGRKVRLTVGPWRHSQPAGLAMFLRDTLDWSDTHVRGQLTDDSRGDVRVFVMGAERWVDLPDWPPPATPRRWYLQPGGELRVDPPPPSAPDVYRYDPNDPTPGIGGASLEGRNSGPKDNRRLESRPDVLTYTSEALPEDMTIIGEITAELHVRSSVEHTDFFVRLCDVTPKRRSINLCDGIVRLRPGDVQRGSEGWFAVSVSMFPTAHTFRRGHRIRVQVSSGAHPIYARNPGSGEPLAKATTFVAADQEIFHDPDRPSALMLPIVATVPRRGRLGRRRSWRD